MPAEPEFFPETSFNAETHYASGRPKPNHLQNLKNWHTMVIDYMLLNPSATQQEIADHFGYARETVMHVINSDLFQAKLEERREQFQRQVDGTAIERLSGKIAGVAERALDVLDEKIQLERQTLGIEQTRETAEMALKALGYGAKPVGSGVGNGTTINITVSKEDLASARARMLPAIEQPALPGPGERESE